MRDRDIQDREAVRRTDGRRTVPIVSPKHLTHDSYPLAPVSEIPNGVYICTASCVNKV